MSRTADELAIVAAKKVLRDAVRRRRAARAPQQRQQDDEARFARLVELLPARTLRRLAAYLSTGSEPDSLRLVAWCAAHDIEVLLPVLTDGAGGWLTEPAWAVYEGPGRLREGRSGILEPVGPLLRPEVVAGVDLIVVPGLAADGHGNRLGRGGGWYDRARVAQPALETWLLLHDDEVLEVVPVDAWDLPVTMIITPTRTIGPIVA